MKITKYRRISLGSLESNNNSKTKNMNDLNHAQHTVAKVDILSKYNSNNDLKLRNWLRAKWATFTKNRCISLQNWLFRTKYLVLSQCVKKFFSAVMEIIPSIVCDTLYSLGLHDKIPSWKVMDNKGRVTVVLHWDPEEVAALRGTALPAIAGPTRQSSTCSTIASGGPRLLGIRSISQRSGSSVSSTPCLSRDNSRYLNQAQTYLSARIFEWTHLWVHAYLSIRLFECTVL